MTGDFDAVLQLRESALQRLLHAMHAAEVLRHRHTQVVGDEVVDLQVPSAVIALEPALHADGRTRARAVARVLYNARPVGDASDVGTNAVADVTLRAAFELPGGDPAPLGASQQYTVDFAETTEGDITVHNPSVAVQTKVKQAVLKAVHGPGRLAFELPRPGSPGQQVSSLAFRVLPGSVLAFGMNFTGLSKGARAQLHQSVVGVDWALALSTTYLRSRIYQSLAAELGAVPPPAGPAPVVLREDEFCLIPAIWPASGCWDSIVARLSIDRLNVGFELGRVTVTGTLAERTEEWYVPDVIVDFHAEGSLKLGAAGAIEVVGLEPRFQLQPPLDAVLATLGLDRVLSAAIGGALQLRVGTSGVSELFSAQLLTRLASLGSPNVPSATPRAVAVEVRPDVVIIHGTLDVADQPRGPVATFDVLPVRGSPTRRVFHGNASWTPGSEPVIYDWDFGDGTAAATARTGARFVVDHDYQPGTYTACLTLVDAGARLTRICQTVTAGALVLARVPSSWELGVDSERAALPTDEWRLCPPAREVGARPEAALRLEFAVIAPGHGPVEDVTVRVGGQEWSDEAMSDAGGRAVFEVPLDGFTIVETAGVGLFYRGSVSVRATKPGYATQQRTLQLYDCDAIQAALGQKVGALKEQWTVLDALVPSRPRIRLDSQPALDDSPPSIAPRAREAKRTAEVLLGVAELVAAGSPLTREALLFGGKEDGDRSREDAFRRSFDDAVDSLSRHVEGIRSMLPDHSSRAR